MCTTYHSPGPRNGSSEAGSAAASGSATAASGSDGLGLGLGGGLLLDDRAHRAGRELTVALLGLHLEVLLVDDGLLDLRGFLHELLPDLVGGLLHDDGLDHRLGDQLVGDLFTRRLDRGCVGDRLLQHGVGGLGVPDLDQGGRLVEALVEDLLGAGLGRGLDDIGLDDGFGDRLGGGLVGDLVHFGRRVERVGHRGVGRGFEVFHGILLGQESRSRIAFEKT